MSKYGVISGPYFPVFGLNTEIYEVNLRIPFEYRKIRSRNNSDFGHFSRSENMAQKIHEKQIITAPTNGSLEFLEDWKFDF